MTTPTPAPLPWEHCAHGTSAADPVGCRGVRVPRHAGCLAHLDPDCKAAYLASLTPGDDIDLSGTTIDKNALAALLTAMTDPATGHPRIGRAQFGWASFSGDAGFGNATFTGNAWFGGATFTGKAEFRNTTFTGKAEFGNATFTGDAWFSGAIFTGRAWFDGAIFSGDAGFIEATFTVDAWLSGTAFTDRAGFNRATFGGDARFDEATFSGDAEFGGVTFSEDAWFVEATFDGLQHLGPLRCRGRLNFDRARFTGSQLTVEAAAGSVTLQRTTFAGTASLRLRYAQVSLGDATLGASMALQARQAPFAVGDTVLDESMFSATGASAGVRLMDLEGVDAGNLLLTDVDLSRCCFAGVFHLDQIQIGFGCAFAKVPAGWRRRGGLVPLRWSRRKTLAEEHHWRALGSGVNSQGWQSGPDHPRAELTPGPNDLTEIYQRLRKAFEDAGDEPDAADRDG